MKWIKKKKMHNWKMQIIKLIAGGCFVFSAFCVQAQDSLTVEQAVAYTLQNSYDILLAKNDSLVAAINYSYRNAAFLPTVNSTGNLLYNNNNQRQTLADGSVKERTGITSTNLANAVSLNLTVFDGFRMFIQRSGLDIALRQGSFTIKNAVVNTVATVINTYYDIVRQGQQLANIQEQIALAADRLRLAQYKFDIGVGIKPDVLQAQIDLNNSRAAALNQQVLIARQKQTLNQLMNFVPAADYKVSDTIPVRMNLLLGDLLNNLVQSSPQLLSSRANIEAADLALRLAKTDRYPTVSLVGAYNFSRTSNSAVINSFSPLFNLNRGFNYGVSLSVPILNNFTVRRNIRQAQLAVSYQQLQYKNQELLVNTGVQTSFKNYEGQKQVLTILDSNVVLARQNLFIERERYRLGNTTFIELRQAEENVSTTITNLINARYALKQAETELLRLRGELVK